MIGAGELKYILTELGEKMSEEEVQELMNATQMGAYVQHPLTLSQRKRTNEMLFYLSGMRASTTKALYDKS